MERCEGGWKESGSETEGAGEGDEERSEEGEREGIRGTEGADAQVCCFFVLIKIICVVCAHYYVITLQIIKFLKIFRFDFS